MWGNPISAGPLPGIPTRVGMHRSGYRRPTSLVACKPSGLWPSSFVGTMGVKRRPRERRSPSMPDKVAGGMDARPPVRLGRWGGVTWPWSTNRKSTALT